jgi:hypothetical protein
MNIVWLKLCRGLEFKANFTTVSNSANQLVCANLLKAANFLLEKFQCSHENIEDCLCQSVRDKTMKKLQLYGLDTDELIHQFYIDQYQVQRNLPDDQNCGSLTIQCSFKDNFLEVHIKNGKNLVPIKSQKFANIHAKLYLLPAHKFQNLKVSKTKLIKNSMFPMFDEKIEMYGFIFGRFSPMNQSFYCSAFRCLIEDAKVVENGLLMIRLKGKRVFSSKDSSIADGLIAFDEILKNDERSPIQLPLQRLLAVHGECGDWKGVITKTILGIFCSIPDCDIVEALTSRNFEKNVQQLLKRIKTKT